jgi:hypothetical protein
LHGMDHLLIDATERAYHRSTDDAKQREHYSGKKNYGGKLSLSLRRDVRYYGYTNIGRYARWHAEHPARLRPRPKHSNHASGTVLAVATRCGWPITTTAPSRRSQVSYA